MKLPNIDKLLYFSFGAIATCIVMAAVLFSIV